MILVNINMVNLDINATLGAGLINVLNTGCFGCCNTKKSQLWDKVYHIIAYKAHWQQMIFGYVFLYISEIKILTLILIISIS